MKDYHGQSVWIIGASSGIGRSLAIELARRGAILTLSARREDDLQQLIRELQGTGHLALPVDVMGADKLKTFATTLKIDRMIFMAAAYEPMDFAGMKADARDRMIDVNIKGCFNAIDTVLPIMTAQKSGQIAICASVAGYRGLAGGQPYSATKAALINLAESLRLEAQHHQIDVRLINPGFVRTPLTDKNSFVMPMIITPERAAQYIADGLCARRFMISFPPVFAAIMRIIALLPYGMYFAVAKRLKK